MVRENILSSWQKNRALKSYMKKLPDLLQSRYGASNHYTRAQIEKTVAECSLNSQFVDYAIVMFSEPHPDQTIKDRDGKMDNIREYLATTYFGGNSGFSVVDVKAVAASSWLAESGVVDAITGSGGDDGNGFGGDGGGGGDG